MGQLSRESVFFQHQMNKMMLKGTPLPQYDPQELAIKYIQLAKGGGAPTDEQVDLIRTKIIDRCKKVHGDDAEAFQKAVAGLDATWPVMRERFAGSLALTMLTLEHFAESLYWYQYLYITGIRFYGLALVVKDGWGVPVSAGTMETPILERIPQDDPMFMVCVEEPSHAGRRVTDGSVQTTLRKAARIFDGGCGLATAYWNYDYPLGQNGQEIVLCDQDGRLVPYLPMVFKCGSLEELKQRYNVKFVQANLLDEMARPEYEGKFDVVRLTGLLSYQPKKDKLEIMKRAQQMLAPGGVIIADEWVSGASLVRTALSKLWIIDPGDPHRLNPAPDKAAAVAGMDAICKELHLPYIYIADYCNGNPVCWTQQYAQPKCVLFIVGDEASGNMLDQIPGAELPHIVV